MQGHIPYWGANSVQDYVDRALVTGPTVLIGEDGAPFFDRTRSVAFYVSEPIWPNNHIHVLKPKSGVDPRWMAYALNSVDYSRWITGSTRDKLTQGDLMNILLPACGATEQRAIGDFLDRETAKIDALIEKQNKLIVLLSERRNTLILRYVTGVYRDENRRVVRIGWVNSIPVSWTSQRIDYLASVTLGKMVTPTPPNEQYVSAPYLRAANVQPNGATAFSDLQEMWFSPPELTNLTVHAGDVVVVEGGQGGFGRAAYVDVDLPGVGFQNSINRLRPTTCDGRFLTYALIAVRNTGFLHAYCDTVSMPHLTSEKLAGLRIAVPPRAEQSEIADRLDLETAKIDSLVAKAEEFVSLARERRAALINAAVTGQIDVLGEAS